MITGLVPASKTSVIVLEAGTRAVSMTAECLVFSWSVIFDTNVRGEIKVQLGVKN